MYKNIFLIFSTTNNARLNKIVRPTFW